MKKHNYLKQVITAIIIIVALLAACYGAYHLYYFAIDAYQAAVAHAAQEIQASVSGGIQEGVGRSLNPVRAVKGVFGIGRSKSSSQQ
jgi:hypothetical protein